MSLKRPILFLASLLTNAVLYARVSPVYTTDWVGNTSPINSVIGGWVGNCARSMWVAPDGVIYTASLWDENGRGIGVYKNGAAIGATAGPNYVQGSSITGDATYLFAALQGYPGYVGRWSRNSLSTDVKFQVSLGTGDCCPGLADYNGTLVYASDNPGNRIMVYTTAGAFARTWNVTAPGAIALESTGTYLWVANKTAGTVTRYNTNSGAAGAAIQMASGNRPSSLHINAAGELWVGDQGPDQNIKIYTNLTGTPILSRTYGVTGGYLSTANGAIMGQTGPMRFTRVVGIGSDTAGNAYVLNNPWGGTSDLGRNGKTDLHCYNSSATFLYALQALNFEGNAAPDPGTSGANLYSGDILYNKTGGAGFLANTVNPFLYPSDARIDTATTDRGRNFGQVACIGSNRILIAYGQNADMFWSYYFNAANGYIAIPGQVFAPGKHIRYGFCLDAAGSVWTGLDKTNAIQYNELTGFSANGAPIWAAAVSTPIPSTIVPLARIAYVSATDTMVLTGGTSTDWTLVGDRVEVYQGWKSGNRTPNKVITITRAVAKAVSATGNYLFVGYFGVPNVDVFDLTTGALVLTLVSNNNVSVGNDTDSMFGVSAYLGPDGTYLVTKDNYNTNSVVVYRWNPNGLFQTTNVIDSNAHTLIQATSTSNANQADQSTFAANIATAFTNNMGGVVNFDVAGNTLTPPPTPSILALYGPGASKSLSIGVTSNSATDISPLAPPSGTAGIINCLSAPNGTVDPNLGDITFTMGAITGGLTNEKVTSFAFTYLTQTAFNNLTLTVTATFSDDSTSVVTRAVNGNTNPVNDTFFGFVAPAGTWIISVAVVSNTTQTGTTRIDDVGFITSVVNPSCHTTNVINPNGHTLLQATSTSNANQTNQSTFATSLAAAYASNLAGVLNFDAPGDVLTPPETINARYGSGKTLAISLTGSSALATSPLAPPSGSNGIINCLSAPNEDPNLGDITFTLGAITGGLGGEKVTSFAFTYLTETAVNGISVTVTATFSDNSTSVVTRTVNRNTTNPVNDTFYGFVAPAGTWISSLALASNANRGGTTNIDDVGFVTQSFAPVAPDNLIATTASSNQINLTWTDNSSNETGFNFDRTTDSSFSQNLTTGTVSANTVGYSDTGLDVGTTYYYRVRATSLNGDSANSATASATTFRMLQEWRQQYFGTTSNSGIAADSADPDYDGIPNLLEYALDSNPKTGEAGRFPVAAVMNSYLTLKFRQSASAAGITYHVQVASDLDPLNWGDVNIAAHTVATGTDVDGTPTLTVRDDIPISASTRRFMRLMITNP